jgi:hypothetical protein
MQYAERLPNTRSLVVPMVSLVIGAAGAVGIYAALDETDVTIQPTRVVVQQPNEGASAKHESSTASALGGPRQRFAPEASGKDEASTAAAVGGGSDTVDQPSQGTQIGGPH